MTPTFEELIEKLAEWSKRQEHRAGCPTITPINGMIIKDPPPVCNCGLPLQHLKVDGIKANLIALYHARNGIAKAPQSVLAAPRTPETPPPAPVAPVAQGEAKPASPVNPPTPMLSMPGDIGALMGGPVPGSAAPAPEPAPEPPPPAPPAAPAGQVPAALLWHQNGKARTIDSEGYSIEKYTSPSHDEMIARLEADGIDWKSLPAEGKRGDLGKKALRELEAAKKVAKAAA